MNNTNIARLRLQINTTIQEDIRRLAEKPGKKKSRFSFKLIARQLSQLFCNIHNSKTTFQLMILYWCSISIYYFGLILIDNNNNFKYNKWSKTIELSFQTLSLYLQEP